MDTSYEHAAVKPVPALDGPIETAPLQAPENKPENAPEQAPRLDPVPEEAPTPADPTEEDD